MPISRYEIRNEYTLADPELYRSADKDDPEALLEGVAMAGLVGVLRQLGDLAEFAAEIFHNLHEEVMVTAARGHGLMTRVQQLETEVPYIEKAFLSQTDHSSFFYHAGDVGIPYLALVTKLVTGVDWHPEPRIEQNLVTQGDLPRFIMDSYEECRGPPRLFLLDKFDVAGAGACLKRYTDPSFFKVDTTAMTSADVQREKKTRKTKKKGPRWRNGETPEVLTASHAKLHQLFLEEPVENGVSKPSHRAKLRRRLNGFPFDSKSGSSYMEKLLKSPSPDHKVLHEATEKSSPLMLATNDRVSLDRESVDTKTGPPSPDREEILLKPLMYEPNDVAKDDKISVIPNSCPNIVTDGIKFTLDKVIGEKVIAMDAESKREDSLTGYQSDDITSEIDNYVDAPSTIESEMDTDSELRLKSDFAKKNQPLIYDANEDHLPTRSSDSHSTGDTTISYEGTLEKEMSSSLSSDSPSTSAENPQSEKVSTKRFPSADIPKIELVDALLYKKSADEIFPVDQNSKPMVSDYKCTDTDAITDLRPDFDLTSSLRNTNSIPTFARSDSGVRGPDSDEMASTLGEEENKTNLVIDPPCSPNDSNFESQLGDDTPRSSAGEHLAHEPNVENVLCVATVSDILSHITDNSVTISVDLPHEDQSDQEDHSLGENIPSMVNTSNVLSQSSNGTPEMMSTENPIPVTMENEVSKLLENLSGYPDIAHGGEDIELTVAKGENLVDELDNEDLNIFTVAPKCSPCITETSLERILEETSFANARTVDAEDNHSNSSIDNQIASENLKLSHLSNSSNCPPTGVDRDVIPEEETKIDENLVTSKSSEDLGLRAGVTDHVAPDGPAAIESSHCTPKDHEEPVATSDTVENDGITLCTSPAAIESSHCTPKNLEELVATSDTVDNDGIILCTRPAAIESSRCTPKDLEEPIATSDTVENDGMTLCTSTSGPELTEISVSEDPESLKEVHRLSDESDSETGKSKSAHMASAVHSVSENAERDDVSLPVGISKLVEEQIPHFETLENVKTCLSGSYRESGLMEEVGQTEGLGTVFCNTIKNDNSKSEVSDTVLSHRDLEVDHSLEFVDTTKIQSLLEQNGLDTEHEYLQESDVGNHATAPSLPINHDIEESISQEKIELPPNRIDQELPDSGEINSELSSLTPINHQTLDHDDHKEDNDSASVLSLVNFPIPPSASELPRLNNYEIDVSENSKDSLCSNFPPINPFSDTNQINLDDLPPLPLPPVQWIMGKLQHASSTTEGEVMKPEELFQRGISPPTTDVSSSLEAMNHSLIQIAPETTSKEEKAENSCSSLEATAMHETIDLPTKMDNNQHQFVIPTLESESASTAEADGVANGSQTVKLPRPCNPLIDEVAALDKSKVSTLIQIAPDTTSKEEKAENSCSSLEATAMHETIDLPTKIDNNQHQFVIPTLESESASTAEADGVANGSQTVKLPRPRNPLIDEVAALDKSKLRKVTERVRPEIQKVDERDSFLEQIRSKSFNLKPAVASRPSIRGPKTNLNVAAILEKANAIRQAFAGSDEDDEDSWSDS
ncbi:hypothetical protein BUALT_Bualt09G0132400 [Buddleja alternifolia]|uniref:Protein SCAR n=1 Tax=Buddleja alternifolia TaxID=168488 RepID=A0AAV6X9M4_9LAMI|nr:hypothetical protein BUALT_Bualt09G0132400 [Buddleja alternifolia]